MTDKIQEEADRLSYLLKHNPVLAMDYAYYLKSKNSPKSKWEMGSNRMAVIALIEIAGIMLLMWIMIFAFVVWC